MNRPSRADWGSIDENDLDANWALDAFLDKSFSEAEAMFESNALYYQEDLQSMPAAAFNFYAPALAKYIMSERAKADSDGASSFLHLVSGTLKSRREVVDAKTERLLVQTASHIAQRQEFYEADVSIYGDFKEIYAHIQSLFQPGA